MTQGRNGIYTWNVAVMLPVFIKPATIENIPKVRLYIRRHPSGWEKTAELVWTTQWDYLLWVAEGHLKDHKKVQRIEVWDLTVWERGTYPAEYIGLILREVLGDKVQYVEVKRPRSEHGRDECERIQRQMMLPLVLGTEPMELDEAASPSVPAVPTIPIVPTDPAGTATSAQNHNHGW